MLHQGWQELVSSFQVMLDPRDHALVNFYLVGNINVVGGYQGTDLVVFQAIELLAVHNFVKITLNVSIGLGKEIWTRIVYCQ